MTFTNEGAGEQNILDGDEFEDRQAILEEDATAFDYCGERGNGRP
jgi:hypothetical protein